MDNTKNKISSRQLFIIFAVAILSPATRIVPMLGAKFAQQAGWVSAVLGVLAFLVLTILIAALFRRGGVAAGLGELYELVFGKITGKAVMFFYLAWTMLVYIMYIRYYAERMLSTIFTTTDLRFFVFVMMVLVFIALRGRIEVIARFSEISIVIFTAALIIIAIGIVPIFKIENVWPVTHMDTLPVLEAGFPITGMLGFFTLFMFLACHVSDKQNLAKNGRRTALYLGVFLTMISAACLGTLSYQVANRSPAPFFSTAKLITVIEPFERIEAMLFSVWVISDFVVITVVALILIKLLKQIFGLSDTKCLALPLSVFGYAGGVYVASSVFELEMMSHSRTGAIINCTIGYVIPLIALAVGKIRKKL